MQDDQVSKVFNDGQREMTKGSRVIRYTDENNMQKVLSIVEYSLKIFHIVKCRI